MGFAWNGIHTTTLGILAEARSLPVLPEPIVITEEIPSRDGYYDFSAVNGDGRVHYRPREWEYKCSFETRLKDDRNKRIDAITRLFANYDGYLIHDQCQSVRWAGAITNKINLTAVASTLHSFNVYFRTQPFAEGLLPINANYDIPGGATITVNNPGTWYVRPRITLTGDATGTKVGGLPVPYNGHITNADADGPELSPGENNIIVANFTGLMQISFVPLYVWEAT